MGSGRSCSRCFSFAGHFPNSDTLTPFARTHIRVCGRRSVRVAHHWHASRTRTSCYSYVVAITYELARALLYLFHVFPSPFRLSLFLAWLHPSMLVCRHSYSFTSYYHWRCDAMFDELETICKFMDDGIEKIIHGYWSSFWNLGYFWNSVTLFYKKLSEIDVWTNCVTLVSRDAVSIIKSLPCSWKF